MGSSDGGNDHEDISARADCMALAGDATAMLADIFSMEA